MVRCPARRIVEDVLANMVQGFFLAEDVFIIAALPDGAVEVIAPHPSVTPILKPRTMEPIVFDVPQGRAWFDGRRGESSFVRTGSGDGSGDGWGDGWGDGRGDGRGE